MNYFGLEFEQCFRLVLLQEVALQIHPKLMRPELGVRLWKDPLVADFSSSFVAPVSL